MNNFTHLYIVQFIDKKPKCTNIYLFCVLSDEIIVEHCNSDYRRICLSRKEARELYTHPGPHDNS